MNLIRRIYESAVYVPSTYTEHKHSEYKYGVKAKYIFRKIAGIPFAIAYYFLLIWIISTLILNKSSSFESDLRYALLHLYYNQTIYGKLGVSGLKSWSIFYEALSIYSRILGNVQMIRNAFMVGRSVDLLFNNNRSIVQQVGRSQKIDRFWVDYLSVPLIKKINFLLYSQAKTRLDPSVIVKQ